MNETFKHNSGAVMRRAWDMFRKTYSYPSIPFGRIGRHCFASCLRRAWAEAKDAAAVAAIAPAEKAVRIGALEDAIRFAPFGESWTQARHEISAARAEIARLSA